MKSKKWGKPLLCLAGFPASLLLFSSLMFTGEPLIGYESYHDPSMKDSGYCCDCHPGFSGGQNDSLHALHTGGTDPMTSNCNLCHDGTGRDNPLTMWSTGEAGIQGLGCMGCHGRDYGQGIEANYKGLTITGLKKNSGYGLRRVHALNEVTECADCHDDTGVTPYPENVINPGLGNTVHYYMLNDVNLGGNAIESCVNEDTANDADGRGLDNDGDGLYDANDPDCVVTPGRLAMSPLNSATGTFTLSWPAPSAAWRLQQNPLLNAAGWVDATQPNRAQRVNGYWTLEFTPQQAAEFFRLTN